MPINSQKGHCVCSWKKGYKARAPNSNIVFLTLTNKSCFEFGCPGWYLLVKGRFVWGTHQLSKKKIGKFSFAQNSVSVSSLPVALWEFLESTYWFYIQGFLVVGVRWWYIEEANPFSNTIRRFGECSAVSEGRKKLCEVENFEQHTFFLSVFQFHPQKSQWGIIL